MQWRSPPIWWISREDGLGGWRGGARPRGKDRADAAHGGKGVPTEVTGPKKSRRPCRTQMPWRARLSTIQGGGDWVGRAGWELYDVGTVHIRRVEMDGFGRGLDGRSLAGV
jgi:hypothetical protein